MTSRPVDPLPVLLRRRRIDLVDHDRHLEESLPLLRRRAAAEGLRVVGEPVSVFPWPDEGQPDSWYRQVEVCLPVAGEGDAVLPGGRLVHTEVSGRPQHPQLLAAYGAVAAWAHREELDLTTPPVLVHVRPGLARAGWVLPGQRPARRTAP